MNILLLNARVSDYLFETKGKDAIPEYPYAKPKNYFLDLQFKNK